MAKTKDNNNAAMVAEMLSKFSKPMMKGITVALPLVIATVNQLWSMYKQLPKEEISLLIGCIICFFGGVYPTFFAAITAAKHGGISVLTKALGELADEAIIIINESKKDDKVDADNDGIADVKQISNNAYILRKAKLVGQKMNPKKVDHALSAMYKVWLSVMAVLAVQFAKTVALSVSISEFLQKPVDRFLSPVIQIVVPDEYDKWVPILLNWAAKCIAMSIAWYIQAIIYAATSAMTGSVIATRALLLILKKKGFNVPEDLNDTSVDEIMGYCVAFLGFYFQFKMNFSVPFPFNVLLFPLEIAEYYIRWMVTYAK